MELRKVWQLVPTESITFHLTIFQLRLMKRLNLPIIIHTPRSLVAIRNASTMQHSESSIPSLSSFSTANTQQIDPPLRLQAIKLYKEVSENKALKPSVVVVVCPDVDSMSVSLASSIRTRLVCPSFITFNSIKRTTS